MASLFISSWAKADGTSGPRRHAVIVIFVCLNVLSKFELHMLVVIKVSSGHDVSRRYRVHHAISMRECVQPKHTVAHQPDHHDMWDIGKRQRVVTAARSVFHGTGVAFDFRYVFILCTDVEAGPLE